MATLVTGKAIDEVCQALMAKTHRWLVTGVAGFIGSHLLESLLLLGQEVVGLDNFSTGRKSNLENVKGRVGPAAWSKFIFYEGDICDPQACEQACRGVEYVLHQAALGSVPRSIEFPLQTNEANVVGFLQLAQTAVEARVKRFVYASSSSVYGTNSSRLKVEEEIGKALSPYAASKRANEVYAESFMSVYGLPMIGLRYFNVFGSRQNPEGAYAAVIPRWLHLLSQSKSGEIFGDGQTTRDFCYVANVVQANLLASVARVEGDGEVFNIAFGDSTSLVDLYRFLGEALVRAGVVIKIEEPIFKDFRKGDVRSSLADISKAQNLLGYRPSHDLRMGIEDLVRQEFPVSGNVKK